MSCVELDLTFLAMWNVLKKEFVDYDLIFCTPGTPFATFRHSIFTKERWPLGPNWRCNLARDLKTQDRILVFTFPYSPRVMYILRDIK